MPESKAIAILGSARSDGNTKRALGQLSPTSNYDLIDLQKLDIKHYQYESSRLMDEDFLPIIERLVDVQHIIFATQLSRCC